ncbi:MAG: hypothetical protein R3F44_07280 [Candidatus Competibacteraceae bacterium]
MRPAAVSRSISSCVARSPSPVLLEQKAKAVVVACNTATAAIAGAPAFPSSSASSPRIKPAVATTRSGVVGILATGNTVRSDKFAALLNQHGQRARVIVQPCPGLADCVERGRAARSALPDAADALPATAGRGAPIPWCWVAPITRS